MSWFIYEFKHNETEISQYFPIKNKNINEVRYNIRSKRLKIAIGDIENYKIIQYKELTAKTKNEALLEFNSIMNSNDNDIEDNLPNIIEKINELKIEDTTKKSYIDFISNIFKIYFGIINSNNSFSEIVKNRDIFITKMEEKYDNITTRREYIVKFLRIVKLLEYDKETIESLTELMYKYQDSHLDVQDEKRLEEIIITTEDLLRKVNDLYDKEEIDEMTLLILITHILIPKRDDYKNIKMIYDDRSDEELINNEEIKNKYDGVFIVKDNKFIITKYKNAKTYKEDKFIIDNPILLKIVEECNELYPERDLYYHNKNGEAYKSVSNIIKKYLDISLNDLRKIYTKEKGTYEAKKQLKHSATTSRAYYKRK